MSEEELMLEQTLGSQWVLAGLTWIVRGASPIRLPQDASILSLSSSWPRYLGLP